jgi:FtsH-binding integral membrane protein
MKKIFFLFAAALYSTLVLAQETKDVNVNINTKGSNWYASPWIWVVGAAIFILLLVALTRGNRRD